jgi:hypothetical protein
MTNAVNIAQSGSNNQTMRNRIINGAMTIDQRNAGASVTFTDGVFPIDRFRCNVSQSSKMTGQQNAGSVTPPAGFTNYLGMTSTSAYSLGSSDFFDIAQFIEGFNVADLGWGTTNAQPIALSFWVRSSLTGTFGGSVTNSATNRSYVFSYTISAANTWEYKTVTIPGDTSGTWETGNGQGILLFFGMGDGASVSGTAGSWGSTFFRNVTGNTSVVGTNGATFYITGVQLEEGTAASPFENRLYGTELALCQRYGLSLSASSSGLGAGIWYATSAAVHQIQLPVTMRAAPTISINTAVVIAYIAGTTVTSSAGAATTNTISPSSVEFYTPSFSGATAGQGTSVRVSTGTIFLSAEL